MRSSLVALLLLACGCDEDVLFTQDIRGTGLRTETVFGGNSCVACHDQPRINGLPSVGGTGPRYEWEAVGEDGPVHRGVATGTGPLDSIPYPISFRRTPNLLGIGLLLQVEELPDKLFGAKATHTLPDFIREQALPHGLGVGDPPEALVTGHVEFLKTLTSPPPKQSAAILITRFKLKGTDDLAARTAKGEVLFDQAECSYCHTPSYQLATGQLIWPYGDGLTHYMGPLLDDKVDHDGADSGDWRTPWLWGFVWRRNGLMHDGRAREGHTAILMHGGEADLSREAYEQMTNGERFDLRLFLNTL